MDAFLFTVALFVFWGLVGWATIIIFPPRLSAIENVLISPAIGISVTILLVFFLNRQGIPVKDFGGILLPVLAGIAALIIMIKRPHFPFKQCIPLFFILIAALLLVAWRMFFYGFDWVSVGNDDMANYCLAAQRFLNHGFYELPDTNMFLSGKDYSLSFWSFHAVNGVRSGSELMLAAIWAFSGLNAIQIFMPVIMALHLSLICGAGSMVAGRKNSRRAVVLSMGLMAISPMTSLGALSQLIGQVGGLGLLCATITLMYRPLDMKLEIRSVKNVIPAVICFAALFVWYPEVLPFLGLGWFGYIILLARRNRYLAMMVIVQALLIGFIVFILLNKFVFVAILFMIKQSMGGMPYSISSAAYELFPFFRIPTGIPAVWGLMKMAPPFIQEPMLSLAIFAGIILTYWLICRVIPEQVRCASKPISILLVMLALSLVLFYNDNGFGLFKLAMYIQPPLIAVVALHLSSALRASTNYLARVIFFIIIVLLFITQQRTHLFHELMGASSHRLVQRLDNLSHLISKDIIVVSDMSNPVLVKLTMLYFNGTSIFFLTKEMLDNIAAIRKISTYPKAINIDKALQQYQTVKFLDSKNTFQQIKSSLIKKQKIIYLINLDNVYNSYQNQKNEVGSSIFFKEMLKNHLVFIHSNLGPYFFSSGNFKYKTNYQLESNPMFPGQKVSSHGRFLLLQIIHPTRNPHLVIEMTSTLLTQFSHKLPNTKVQTIPLHFVGRGSGRIFSDSIRPTYINETPYLFIDMGRNGRTFTRQLSGLEYLYGRNVKLDSRYVATFIRDISLITDSEYHTVKAPYYLEHFPDDLANKDLEYSGVYEDGWLSERSFFVLSPKKNHQLLVIKGNIPIIEDPQFTSILIISMNGKKVAQKKVHIGNFELRLQIKNRDPRQRIDLTFTKYQRLPGDNGRVVGAKMNFIGYR